MIEKFFNLIMLFVLAFGSAILFTLAVCWKMIQALYELTKESLTRVSAN